MSKYTALSIVGVLALVTAAACTSDGVSAPRSHPPASAQDVARRNQEAQQALETMIMEIEPHVRYASDGTWSLDSSAKLSPAALAFARDAQTASARWSVPLGLHVVAKSSLSGAASANQSAIVWYWWGARFSVPPGAISGISEAWSRSGGPGAVKVFLQYFGYSGWAVSIAGMLVPAYVYTIALVDRMGGHRGVFMYVPWSIVPTYITPQ